MKSINVCAVVALLCVALTAYGKNDVCPEGNRHPIIFFPGIFGTRIDEKFDIPSTVPMPHTSCPRKSNDWEPGWIEWKKILPLSNFDCLTARFQMVQDGDKWVNTPGTEFRVPNFGSVKSVDPLSVELSNVVRMYGHTMDLLIDRGFEDEKTLFVGAYDWRVMPTEQWMNDIRELIENAVKSTGKKAVIFSHSMGCPFSYIFLMSQTDEWRQQFIHHYVPVSPVWVGTNIIPFTMITDKIFNFTVAPFTALGSLFRYLEALYVLSPSVELTPDELIATTDLYTYTAKNISILLERVGVKNADAVTSNVQKQLYQFGFEHPGIPVTSVWSVGSNNTLGPFHWPKDSRVGTDEPIPSLVDGDGLVPQHSLSYAYKLWSNGPYAGITEGMPLPGTNHANAPHDPATIAKLFDIACDSV